MIDPEPEIDVEPGLQPVGKASRMYSLDEAREVLAAEARNAARGGAFPKGAWGAGQPQRALLDAWGREMKEAFGHYCYLVGSSCFSKTWRDIDVAMILDDDEWDHLFGPYDDLEQRGGWNNPFLCAMQIAFSTWAREATGLPVDFKIQRMTQANAEFNGPRCALGIMPHENYNPAWRKR